MAFNGSSSFVPDLQQTIDRAVAIASLPLVQLRAQKTKLQSQEQAFNALNEQFAGLQTAIDAVTSSITTDLHSASVGDETIAKATLSGNVLAADYSLEVVSLGARTLTMNLDSLPVVTDPFVESISASGEFTLSAGGVDYTITPAGSSLFDLAAAINASGAGVQATVVNIGGSASPDYRLSLQSEGYSNVSIQLNDGAQDLLQTLSTGSEVTYRVNGIPTEAISSDSRAVTFSPGLTINLLKTGTTDIQISKSTSSLADALESFVTAYNSTVAGLDAHRGVNGGILSGQSVLSALSRPLSQLSAFEAGTGGVRSLADLGISLSNEGTLSLDRTALEAIPVDDVLSFLGDPSTTGFLKTASDVVDAAGNVGGLIDLEKVSIGRQIERHQDLIESNEQRVEVMRQSLTARMAAADALLALLEQRATFMRSLFEASLANKESQ
jgi:flagellar hook-associated protein 2